MTSHNIYDSTEYRVENLVSNRERINKDLLPSKFMDRLWRKKNNNLFLKFSRKIAKCLCFVSKDYLNGRNSVFVTNRNSVQ